MENKKNNLFDFATSELSQDAIIAWLFNWFNDKSNLELHKLSKQLIYQITGISKENIETVKVFRQLTSNVKVDQKDVSVKIDVLIIVNNIAVIIEDKTFTHEHDEQIDTYKSGLQKLIDDNEIPGYDCTLQPINEIITVYWKTGFYDDFDSAVVANYYIKRSDLLKALNNINSNNDIFNDYFKHLLKLEENEKSEQNFEIIKEDFKDIWDKYPNYSWSYVGQYRFLDCLRNDKFVLKKGKMYEPYQVYSDSSSGRPWSQMVVYYGEYQTGDKYGIFFRADTDTKGPYISLRLYENKEQYKTNKDQHKAKWWELRGIVDKILSENDDLKSLLKETYPGKKENYNEASVFHLHLDKYFKYWENGGSEIIEKLRKFNDLFLENLDNAEKRDN